MSDLKKAWKKTAKSFVLAAVDLGDAIVDSAKIGKKKIIDWANTNDEPVQPGDPVEVEGTEIPCEESPADNNSAE